MHRPTPKLAWAILLVSLWSVSCATPRPLSVSDVGTLRVHYHTEEDARAPRIFVDDQFLGHADAQRPGQWTKTLVLPAGRHAFGIDSPTLGYVTRRITILGDPNEQMLHVNLGRRPVAGAGGQEVWFPELGQMGREAPE